MKVNNFKVELLNAPEKKAESVFQKVADAFEDDLLNYDFFPVDHFEFVIDLLSDERFYKKPGVWNFLLVIGTEGHRLTSKHYEEISCAIVRNYKYYENEDLCLSVCDFIARNYEFKTAETLLLSLVEEEKGMIEKGFAHDGLRILALEKKRSNSSGN